ncbi:MAG: thymidylate kinase [Clostridia bacterium]|nr:thymidylate kinase [Clostridia bacterium]
MGKLIAIDGVDASGKQTHTQMLYDRFVSDGIPVRKLSFPMYEKPSSSLVKQYLSGAFGKNPEDVNAYAASTFFAADRFATYRTDWGKDYQSGTLILADRYVASNMIHQAGKITDINEKNRFLDWIYDLEYNIYGLPKPDVQIFLDMPVQYSLKLMQDRINKINGSVKKDIHENDASYLSLSYENAIYVSEKYAWNRVNCIKDNKVRSLEDIQDEIYNIAIKFI